MSHNDYVHLIIAWDKLADHFQASWQPLRYQHVAAERGGYPLQIRCDYGSEFIAHLMQDWAERKGVVMAYIESGKPAQNA